MKFFSLIKKVGAATIISLFISSILGTLVYAQDKPATGLDCTKEYCALTTVPGAFDACKADKNGVVTCDKGPVKNPVSVIKNIYGISIGIGAMLAIVMIIWAGIEYATTEAITGKSDAKEKWQGAAFGLVLLLASYIILRTINVDLVNINLDLGTPKAGNLVDSDILSQIVKTTNETALAAQQAEKNVAEAQNALTAVKNEKASLETQIANENNLQKKADLQRKKDELTTQINNKEKVVVSMNTQKVIANAVNNQQTYMVTQLNSIKDLQTARAATFTATNQTYDLSKDSSTQQEIIKARQGLTARYSTNTLQIRTIDSGQVGYFTEKTKIQLQDFDKQVALFVGCPKGVNVSSTNVTCKN